MLNTVNMFEFFVMSFIGPIMTLIFILLNIISFIIFVLGDNDTKNKWNKIFKFIEPIGVLHSTMFLFVFSVFLYLIFPYEYSKTLYTFLVSITATIFIISNWLGIVSYFNLRFLPIKKLNLSIKKFSSFLIIISILVNLISTIILLITSSFGIIGIYVFLPISASILYLKTLLIVKDDL